MGLLVSYILDLRKIVGHRPLMMVGASVILEDAAGRVLLQRRTDNHCWGYPGGGVELYEDVELAARRDLLEETGLIAGNMELFGVFSGDAEHYTYPNGDEVSIVDIVFLCKEYDGQLKRQEEEVESLAFFDAANIPENIMPPNLPALREWVKRKQRLTDLSN